MIDITNLTSLITAFRNETEQGSISPETLGSLLQAIANELKNASSAQEEIDLETLQTNLSLLKGIVNEMVSNVSRLESVVSEHNSSSASNFNKIANSINDIEQYIESLDGIVSENCSNIESLNALNSRTSYLPVFRGTIVIDASSITSAVRNYFNYSLNDGFFNLVRANQLIGRAYVYTFNGFKIVEVIGLCSINNMSFIYHDRLDHVLLRINSKNEIFVTGSLETIDLQNQINAINERLNAMT